MAKQEQASVILITLVFTTVLMILVGALATAMLSEMRITASDEEQTKAFYLAEGGLEYGRYILNDDDKWVDNGGEEYQNPASDGWYEQIASGDNKIELRRYDDRLTSIANYGRGRKVIEIEYELGMVVLEDDKLEEMPDENHIEDKYISRKEEIDINIGGGGSIEGTTIESTDKEVDIQLSGGGGINQIKNTIVRSKGGIDLKLASGGSIKCTVLESEGNIKINPSNNTTIEDVVIVSKTGEITIDLGNNSSMKNVHIYSDKKPNVKERANTSFVEGEDYYWYKYEEYESYSNHLDCDPGYQGSEAYIEKEGSWKER